MKVPFVMLWRLTIGTFAFRPPELSNFGCLPGEAGGTPAYASGGNSNRASSATALGTANSGAAAGISSIGGTPNSTYATISAPNGGSASTPGSGSLNIGGARTSTAKGGASFGSGGNGTASGGTASSSGSTSVNCSAANVFCDGFEQGTLQDADAGKSWSVNGLDNLKSSSLGYGESEVRVGFNSDKALAIHISGVPYGRGGWLEKHLMIELGLTEDGTVRIEFDFYFVQSDYSGLAFYPFSLICGPNNYHLTFNADDNTIREKGGGISNGEEKHRTTKSIDWTEENVTFESWQHVGLVMNRSTRTVSMTLGGISILEPPELILKGYLPGASCIFAMGVMYAGESDPISFDAYFDNVQIQVN